MKQGGSPILVSNLKANGNERRVNVSGRGETGKQVIKLCHILPYSSNFSHFNGKFCGGAFVTDTQSMLIVFELRANPPT